VLLFKGAKVTPAAARRGQGGNGRGAGGSGALDLTVEGCMSDSPRYTPSTVH
jgi:hypothetical protein